ncbi:ABC transporter ATP-binding protein [Undibacterium sp. FT137W]|uniref:ABC transporter ATP-binding protein n=2 Tax=Undibacterium fentianense TaxID=2828728 RepID=A0A941IDN1_9BURK|nr:ABC transporter ATP-binding protein [Undibacterium fentianense]
MSWAGMKVKPSYEYWANKDISFEVQSGQAVAIIGQNGAGKSTLLKMITGTVRPSVGQITVDGTVSAMLELGLGFNPEFTGRQNAYMAGGLMGLSRLELDQLMLGIEAFAEIGDFFDQPLRVYSSGMQARLAFAVATAVRPDILIVDEILSVGDSYFQHRSFDRIKQFKEQGTSIILVTHGMGDVRSICDHVILIDKGQMLKQGAPDEVVDFYNAMIAQKENDKLAISQSRDQQGWLKTRSGNGAASIGKVYLREQGIEQEGLNNRENIPNEIQANKQGLSAVTVGQQVVLICEVQIAQAIPELVLGIMLRDKQGHIIWGSNTWYTKLVQYDLKAGEKLIFNLPFTCQLGPGSYSVTTALTRGESHLEQNFEWSDNLLVFDVINVDKPMFIGSNWLNAEFQVERDAT